MKLYIPVATGVEASVKRQLHELGYGDCPAVSGRIVLAGDWRDVARLNVCLRAGERVLAGVGEFPAPDFDALFEGVRALPWEQFLSPHSRILMDGKCVKSRLMAVKATGGVVKKAIAERLKEKFGVSSLDERGERAVVGVFLHEDVAYLTLDTSGDGLHKRGYRIKTYDAPLRETTAAAIVESSFFRAGKPFADLFCGSGTLPVEAALYMRRIAPGLSRGFDFERWKCVPKEAAPRAREEARDVIDRSPMPELFAADISRKAVELARFHAARAGVEKDICFRVQDMRRFSSSERCGIILSNPPYGERMKEDLRALYADFGRMYRALPDWSCVFLSAYEGAERAFGGRADKKRRLYNARIACTLYSYFGKPPCKK